MTNLSKFLAFFGLGFLFTFAYLTAVHAAFVLAYAMLLLFGFAFVWLRVAARGLRLRSTLEVSVPAVGEPFQEHFRLTKEGVVPAPLVEVHDDGDLPGYQPGRVLSLGRDPREWTERGVFRRRGWAHFGPTRVQVSEPFGLFRRDVRLPIRNQVLVYPRVVPIPELVTSAQHQAGDVSRMGAFADQPPEAGGVREYSTSDSYGRIHWPLSLRHGQLVSKTFEQPLTADLWLVLDLDRKVHFGSGTESTLEYSVSLAASIAMHVFQRGRTVGLVANDSRGTIVEPSRAGRQDRAILDYLALARADGEIPLVRALTRERVRRLPRRTLAVITPSTDAEWIDGVRALGGRRTAMLVFYVDAASFGGPETNFGFELGSDVDLYVVRRGDDLSHLARTRDAIHIV